MSKNLLLTLNLKTRNKTKLSLLITIAVAMVIDLGYLAVKNSTSVKNDGIDCFDQYNRKIASSIASADLLGFTEIPNSPAFPEPTEQAKENELEEWEKGDSFIYLAYHSVVKSMNLFANNLALFDSDKSFAGIYIKVTRVIFYHCIKIYFI